MLMYSTVYHTSLCVYQCLCVSVSVCLSDFFSQCLCTLFPSVQVLHVSLVSLVTVSPSVSVYPSVYVCQGLCPIVYTLKQLCLNVYVSQCLCTLMSISPCFCLLLTVQQFVCQNDCVSKCIYNSQYLQITASLYSNGQVSQYLFYALMTVVLVSVCLYVCVCSNLCAQRQENTDTRTHRGSQMS